MAVTGTEALLLVAARVLLGGVIAVMGVNHFLDRDQMTDYAAFKGLPAPTVSVLASGAVLVLGGVGIVVGVFPLVSALAVAGFLLVAAVTMHDFWAVEAADRQDELTQFFKNVVMAGGALGVAALATEAWAYSLGIGL